MFKGNFTEDFKLGAISRLRSGGHSVADVSQRLGVSTHSLYGWMKRYAARPFAGVKDDQSAEIRRLKRSPGGFDQLSQHRFLIITIALGQLGGVFFEIAVD
jgi:transposase